MAYKKRSTRSNYNNPYARNNSRAAACISGYLSPLKDNVQNIKIPDGGANLSCGMRMQNNATYTQAGTAGQNAAQPRIFVIRPNINYGTAHCDEADVGTVLDANMTTKQPYQNAFNSDVVQWRLVSQATRLTPTMNTDNNQGYFEAIRVPSQQGAQQLTVGNFVSSPSFVNGKLRDLHRHIFQLKPRSTDHEFLNYPDDYTDVQFDTIIIKVTGMAVGGTILMYTVANHEYQFKEVAQFKRFEDGAVTDFAGLRRAQAQLMSNIKAATLTSF